MNNEYTIQDQEPATSNQQLSTYSCPRNWVYPILTSVSGNKSDRFIKRQYTAETHRVAACQYENKLTLTHTHTYTQADTEKENTYLDLAGLQDPKARQALLAVEGNGKNRTYMRLYVPKGSTLTGSSIGVESIEKPDATVFTWTFETPVGSESSKTIRYVTDIPDCQSFSG